MQFYVTIYLLDKINISESEQLRIVQNANILKDSFAFSVE